MTTPEYWGNQSVLFSKSWQDKLFCQIEGVSPSEHDIAINYIDIREQQLPPVLARLDGAEPVSYTHLTLPTNREV